MRVKYPILKDIDSKSYAILDKSGVWYILIIRRYGEIVYKMLYDDESEAIYDYDRANRILYSTIAK